MLQPGSRQQQALGSFLVETCAVGEGADRKAPCPVRSAHWEMPGVAGAGCLAPACQRRCADGDPVHLLEESVALARHLVAAWTRPVSGELTGLPDLCRGPAPFAALARQVDQKGC